MRGGWKRILWSAVVAAVWNVGLCSVVDLVAWQLRYFSHPLGVVWTGSVETLLWRGFVVGVLVGWWATSDLVVVAASVAGGIVLAGIHVVSLVAMGTHLRYALDTRVVISFVLNGLFVGVVSSWLVRCAMKEPHGGEGER